MDQILIDTIMNKKNFSIALLLVISVFIIITSGCSPTIKLAAPDKPITINLNIKIQHEIRVKVEQDLEDMFNEDSELF